MSDDLVKFLRNRKDWPMLGNAAADRIEQLEDEYWRMKEERDSEKERAETAEAKLATIVAIVRSHYTGDMQREDMEVRRILQRIDAALTGGPDGN